MGCDHCHDGEQGCFEEIAHADSQTLGGWAEPALEEQSSAWHQIVCPQNWQRAHGNWCFPTHLGQYWTGIFIPSQGPSKLYASALLPVVPSERLAGFAVLPDETCQWGRLIAIWPCARQPPPTLPCFSSASSYICDYTCICDYISVCDYNISPCWRLIQPTFSLLTRACIYDL